MRKSLLLLLPLLLFISCTDAFEQEGVEVKFINETGYLIENVKVDGHSIGDLAQDSSTPYLKFDRFGADSGMPDVAFSGQLGDRQLASTSRYYWCGTQKTTLAPGRYVVTISLVSAQENEELFYLSFLQ
jgi:hypothetical protein